MGKGLLMMAITLVAVLALFLPHGEVHFCWQKLPIWDLLFGFLGCVVLILFSKGLGHLLLERPEDYYD